MTAIRRACPVLSTRARWVASCALVVSCFVGGLTAVPADARPVSSDGADYAAFGDSYSAGEGTNAYSSDTDVPGTNVCHRSANAYAPVLDADLGLGSLGFAACSGAVTADLFGPNANHNRTPAGTVEPAQLCRNEAVGAVAACGAARAPVIGPNTRRVSLTIGGNDVGFADIVRSCVFVKLGRYSFGLPGRGCRRDPLLVAGAARRLAALNGIGVGVQSPYKTVIHSFAAVLAAIHAAAPNARVFIAGYPRLFQPTGDADCVVGAADAKVPIKIAASDARWLDAAASGLDAAIAAAALRAGPWARYVNAPARFLGHGLCTPDPWINPITAKVSFDPITKRISGAVDSGSVHPTPIGQSRGFADAFTAAGIKTATLVEQSSGRRP